MNELTGKKKLVSRLSCLLRSAGPPVKINDTKMPSLFSLPAMVKTKSFDPRFRTTFRGSLTMKQFIQHAHMTNYLVTELVTNGSKD